jgi:hypothetical protein
VARRAFWLATGVVAGAASSLYAERKFRRTLEVASARLQPDALVAEVGRTARQAAVSTGGRVRDAVATGRHEMRRREEEIWAGLATTAVDPAPDPSGARDAAAPVAAADPEVTHPSRQRRRRAAKSPSHLGK